MYICKVRYKLNEDDTYRIGYLIGRNENSACTLLDRNFNPVPKVIDEKGRKFVAWDMLRNLGEQFEINIEI